MPCECWCASAATPVPAPGGPGPFPDGPHPSHIRQATSRSVRHVLPSRAGPPPSVVAADPVHIRSNYLSIPAASDRCFVAACTPFLDRSIGCPLHDRLPPASAIPDCCVQSATLLWLQPHPRGPSIRPQPCVRNPLWSLYPTRFGRDLHQQFRCHASRGCTTYPAWH